MVFVGSSSEGLNLAYALQQDMGRRDHGNLCEMVVWTQGVFQRGGMQLDVLAAQVGESDFAVLIATPDDIVTTRGTTKTTVRDNVILELGMAIGLLGRERSYLVADQSTGGVKLPSDLEGVTHISYRSGTNLAAAVGPVATDVAGRIKDLGPRTSATAGENASLPAAVAAPAQGDVRILGKQRDQICLNARSQGWQVKTNTESTLRLIDSKGRKFTFSFHEGSTYEDLRKFAGALRAGGLRVHQSAHRLPSDPWGKADLPRR